MSIVYGSLFSGYEGLTRGVQAALGPGRTAWVSDIDPGACKILAHRYPDVPNLGDITKVDWAQVEPVDVLTGGFPCQDVSSAGKRRGLRPDTRSGLWTQMAYAIDQLRPSLVVAENVRGLLSAEAHSDVEPCPWCLGDGRGPDLRALGAVLGDLADLGYDASWYGLRAADVGAPHGRFRVFVVAYPNGEGLGSLGWQHAAGRHSDGRGSSDGLRLATQSAALLPTPRTSDTNGAGQHGDGGIDLRTAVSLLPTPTARDHKGANQRGDDTCLTGALLPTPAVNDMGEGKTVESWDEWTATMQAKHGNGNGHGKSLAIKAQRLLPTPRAYEGGGNGPAEHDRHSPGLLAVDYHTARWGQYAEAIARWEALTRPAPAPTQPSKKGTPQLSPKFSEWLMGLPDGWVTDVPGITRNEALKALGNGVVPQQEEAALRFLLALITSESAA